MRRSFSRRDDPDYGLISLFAIGVGHEDNHDGSDQTHCLPALLSFDITVQAADMEWILKNEPGGLEADFVLCEIAPVLVLIPGESHDRSGIITCTKKYVQGPCGRLRIVSGREAEKPVLIMRPARQAATVLKLCLDYRRETPEQRKQQRSDMALSH